MNDPIDEGGGPAGVVEGLEAPNKPFLPLLDLLLGVEGGGLDDHAGT